MSELRYKDAGGRHLGLGFLGVILALPGAAGTLALVVVFLNRLSLFQDHGSQIVFHQAVYEGLWLLVFASLFVLGASLLVSAMRSRTHNVVPGPTLYIMGASLVVIGLMMVMYNNVWQAAVAIACGVLLMVVEWFYDAV